MKAKTHTFRPNGEDEGDVVELTAQQARNIQRRLDSFVEKGTHTDPPYYLYELTPNGSRRSTPCWTTRSFSNDEGDEG